MRPGNENSGHTRNVIRVVHFVGNSAQLGSTRTKITNKSSLNNSLLLYITTITYGFITLCSNSLCAYFCFGVVVVVVVVLLFLVVYSLSGRVF